MCGVIGNNCFVDIWIDCDFFVKIVGGFYLMWVVGLQVDGYVDYVMVVWFGIVYQLFKFQIGIFSDVLVLYVDIQMKCVWCFFGLLLFNNVDQKAEWLYYLLYGIGGFFMLMNIKSIFYYLVFDIFCLVFVLVIYRECLGEIRQEIDWIGCWIL